MNTRALPEGLPGCGRAATCRVEVYSPRDGRAHGSLDASLYVCAEHHAVVRAALGATGLTPYTVPGTVAGPKRCGDGFDFLAMRPVTAPAPTGEAHVSPSGQVQRLDTGEWVPADGAEPDPADPAHGNSGPGGPLPAAPPEDDGPEYQVVVRDEPEDSYVDVTHDGAVIVRWTFDEACQVAQQLADLFGTFTGPASAPRGGCR